MNISKECKCHWFSSPVSPCIRRSSCPLFRASSSMSFVTCDTYIRLLVKKYFDNNDHIGLLSMRQLVGILHLFDTLLLTHVLSSVDLPSVFTLFDLQTSNRMFVLLCLAECICNVQKTSNVPYSSNVLELLDDRMLTIAKPSIIIMCQHLVLILQRWQESQGGSRCDISRRYRMKLHIVTPRYRERVVLLAEKFPVRPPSLLLLEMNSLEKRSQYIHSAPSALSGQQSSSCRQKNFGWFVNLPFPS